MFQLNTYLDYLGTGFRVYAVAVSLVSIWFGFTRLARHWQYRHLKKVWGFRDKDQVVLLCSELDDPEERQWVEPREFIYLMKYGDADAYVEVIGTLFRIYPNIDIQILSSGDLDRIQVDLSKHIILIGGPDYNEMTRRLLDEQKTRIAYYSPYLKCADPENPKEIIIYDRISKRKLFCSETERDYGYFERAPNPFSPKHHVILIGGCHTVGVTAAVKAFSAAGGQRDVSPAVVRNARLVAKHVPKGAAFAVFIEAQKIGLNINTPNVKKTDLLIGTT
jgi:hypothetical protein